MHTTDKNAFNFRHEAVTQSSNPKNALVRGPWNVHFASPRLKRLVVEASQTIQYGRARPRSLERIWVDPRQIRRAVIHPSNLLPELREGADERPFWLARSWRGRVVGAARFAELEPSLRPLSQSIKLEACRRHWAEGVPWSETGVYEDFFRHIRNGREKDECRTQEEVVARYQRLDAIFAEVRAERWLRSQMEMFPGQDRESGGIEVHIGPGGEPIFGDSGNHRLGMALVLGLPRLPAMLGFVHEDGLAWLERYRQERSPEAIDRRRRPVPAVLGAGG